MSDMKTDGSKDNGHGDAEALVCEMANKHKEETLLPMNIWIDETRSYMRCGHGKRIWFQLNKAENFENSNAESMDLDGRRCPPTLNIQELQERDLAALRHFVHNNRYALERIADQEVRLYRIWPDMIKGGERASAEDIAALNAKVDELAAEKRGRPSRPPQRKTEEGSDAFRECEGENSPYRMAHFLHSCHRGLPSNIWISEKDADHEPRITIQRSKGARLQRNDTFGMTISDSPSAIGDVGSDLSSEDIATLKNFVLRNKDPLLAYWNGELDTSGLVDRLAF